MSARQTSRLLPVVGLPMEARGFRTALGGIFDQAGRERRTLRGAITRNGNAVPFAFTRELDQKVRLDIGGAIQRSYVSTGLNSLAKPQNVTTGAGAESTDTDILELLAEDSPEGFLFSFGTATGLHWLGGNYRTDGGTSFQYNGPLYDIYSAAGNSGIQPGFPARLKTFLFDRRTKLLSFTRYQIDRDGAPVSVEVSFTNWSSLGGQMAPSMITRAEGGQTVFSIAIDAASSSASQPDLLFGAIR